MSTLRHRLVFAALLLGILATGNVWVSEVGLLRFLTVAVLVALVNILGEIRGQGDIQEEIKKLRRELEEGYYHFNGRV